jgi:hypothetical protein
MESFKSMIAKAPNPVAKPGKNPSLQRWSWLSREKLQIPVTQKLSLMVSGQSPLAIQILGQESTGREILVTTHATPKVAALI